MAPREARALADRIVVELITAGVAIDEHRRASVEGRVARLLAAAIDARYPAGVRPWFRRPSVGRPQ